MSRAAVASRLGLALTLAIGVHLGACADSPGVSKSKGAEAVMKTAPMKPSGSGIEVRYEVTAAGSGGTATVVLQFQRVADPSGATYRLAADGGLAVAGIGTVQSLPAGATTTVTVEARPPASGIGYLHVFTSQYGTNSVTSIPVQAAGAKASESLPASPDLKKTPGGDRILPMPVK